MHVSTPKGGSLCYFGCLMSSSRQEFLQNESELNKKLKIQVEETLRTEEELAQLIKIRDEQKRKAEKIQRLRNGYVRLHVYLIQSNPMFKGRVCHDRNRQKAG